MSLIKKCKLCDKEFTTKPSVVTNGCGKYCSRKCSHRAQKNGKEIKCFLCGKISYKSKRDLGRSKSNKFFCGKSCQTRWRNQEYIGSKHANWTGGKYSYRSVLGRNGIKKICRLCVNKDKRVMAVHHLDHNRMNNKVENLVWVCHNCHHLIHHYKGEKEKLMAVIV